MVPYRITALAFQGRPSFGDDQPIPGDRRRPMELFAQCPLKPYSAELPVQTALPRN